jgi:hypothetical protein
VGSGSNAVEATREAEANGFYDTILFKVLPMDKAYVPVAAPLAVRNVEWLGHGMGGHEAHSAGSTQRFSGKILRISEHAARNEGGTSAESRYSLFAARRSTTL